jgi:DNA-binding transcriptional LysR family regulator
MALNFHQLHIFSTVAMKGSFSAAAIALHMTQPAVTMQIQSLEDYFGTKLFHRSTKKVELSEAGQALLPLAHRGIDLIRETDLSMSKFTYGLEGRLHLGASLTIGEFILPRLLGAFGSEFPHISVNMKVINTKQILDDVLSHLLTFGLVETEVSHADLHTEAVLSDELMLILPSDHPLNKQESIHFEDLLPYPFVLREKGSGTREVMEKELHRCGQQLNQLRIVMEMSSTGAIKSAVEAGIGLTLLSPASVKHEVALGLFALRSIEQFSFKREFHAIYLNSTLLPISAVTFLSFLRERDLNKWLI